MKYLILFIILAFACSCVSPHKSISRKEARRDLRKQKNCEKAQRKYELQSFKYGCILPFSDTSTSTIFIERRRDTTIYVPVPGEKVHDSIPIPFAVQINTPVSFLTTTYATSRAWIENSVLKHTLIQINTSIPSTIPGAIHDTHSNTVNNIPVPYPVEKHIKVPLSWIEITLMVSGIAFWLFFLLFLAIKIRRFFGFPSL